MVKLFKSTEVNMVKAGMIVTDLDGTLLKDDKTISVLHEEEAHEESQSFHASGR